MFLSAQVLATGTYLPARQVTAGDLDQQLGAAPGTTYSRNGVRTRYFASEAETASAMSAAAIQVALDLDAILFSGVLSEQPMPSTAILIHRRLGGRKDGVTCFDLNASCAGFLKGIEIAATAIQAGLWRRVAVVATEIASKGLCWEDLDTCTLFGDGSAAAIVGPAEGDAGILASRNATVSEGADLCTMRAGGSRFNPRTPPKSERDYLLAMNGRAVLRLVHAELPAFYAALLADAGGAIDVIVPHQASAVGLAYFKKHLAADVPVVEILPEYGNQVSASLGFALDRAVRTGQVRRGTKVMPVATGAGLVMSGMVLGY